MKSVFRSGAVSYTWAHLGQTPHIQTSGKCKGYKIFGLIEFFPGRLFYQGIAGKFNSDAYQAFLLNVPARTSEPLMLIQDGARYHTSKAIQMFFPAQQARLTIFQLPSYSPDYNSIEYLWRETKKLATHNKYFAEFVEVIESVEQALQNLPIVLLMSWRSLDFTLMSPDCHACSRVDSPKPNLNNYSQ